MVHSESMSNCSSEGEGEEGDESVDFEFEMNEALGSYFDKDRKSRVHCKTKGVFGRGERDSGPGCVVVAVGLSNGVYEAVGLDEKVVDPDLASMVGASHLKLHDAQTQGPLAGPVVNSRPTLNQHEADASVDDGLSNGVSHNKHEADVSLGAGREADASLDAGLSNGVCEAVGLDGNYDDPDLASMVGSSQLELDDAQIQDPLAGPVVSSRPIHNHDQVLARLDAGLEEVVRDDVRLEEVDSDNVRGASSENFDLIGVGGADGAFQDAEAMGSVFELSGNSRLCEVPITIADELEFQGVTRKVIPEDVGKGGLPKRRRGRPRKIPTNPQVSDSYMDICSLLVKKPHDVANSVWKIGLDLGVSGFVDDSVIIDKLAEMEKRDQLAIGRSVG
ncbi:hypothetical protein SESBI_14365 [Sesbania bispinosa]|nr:hypothetical protein SESBI_14365 [Sesbania bispinosa]